MKHYCTVGGGCLLAYCEVGRCVVAGSPRTTLVHSFIHSFIHSKTRFSIHPSSFHPLTFEHYCLALTRTHELRILGTDYVRTLVGSIDLHW